MRLWLANWIVATSYRILYWAWMQKLKSSPKVTFAVMDTDQVIAEIDRLKSDRARMN